MYICSLVLVMLTRICWLVLQQSLCGRQKVSFRQSPPFRRLLAQMSSHFARPQPAASQALVVTWSRSPSTALTLADPPLAVPLLHPADSDQENIDPRWG